MRYCRAPTRLLYKDSSEIRVPAVAFSLELASTGILTVLQFDISARESMSEAYWIETRNGPFFLSLNCDAEEVMQWTEIDHFKFP